VDLSALIFVALAVAWAVYLIPKALKHHEDVVRSRSVDRFSHTMRVLARREPVNRRNTRLVVSPGRPRSVPIVTTKASVSATAAPLAATRESARRAARRRRRVLGLILVSLAATAGVAGFGVISWWYVAIPGALLVGWLVACRLMVRREHAQRFDRSLGQPLALPADDPAPAEPPVDALEDTTQTPAITDPSLWDPMPVTLPTYVSKPAAAPRSVRTIDLDSTGVWTSGRTEADAVIAREADAAARARKQQAEHRRAIGS
jgi:hypothetical protein